MGTTGFSRAVRIVVGAFGALLCLGGIGALAAGEAAVGLGLFAAGAVVLLAMLYEQERYRSQTADRGRLQRTDEVFQDPTTGERMRVWFDPATGERRYIPDP